MIVQVNEICLVLYAERKHCWKHNNQGPDFGDLKYFKNDLYNDRKNPEK
jgi:hypothetical protein